MGKNKVDEKDRGIRLDIGCGANKQAGFVGMDLRDLPGVDIVHNLEEFPYPILNEECHIIVASHILEHINPTVTLKLFNELWRITKPGGQLVIAVPYAGSAPYWQDPTHCNGFTETTFEYFDYRAPLWNVYKTQPWRIDNGFPLWQVTGIIECVMTKVTDVEISKKK
jgi:SAM-dependent methyltransferase